MTSRRLFLALLALTALAVAPLPAMAQSVTLTASPTTGISPLSVTLTWNATGFSAGAACTASGSTGFSGAKPLTGTATLSLGGGSYNFAINCANTTGNAVLTWTAPTQNTDGTTISAVAPGALAGFKLYTATTAAGVAGATPVTVADKTATSYTMTGLPVGTNYFAAAAYNTESVASALTGNVTAVIVAPSASASSTVNVNVQPKPPVLTVVSQFAYEINATGNGPKLGRNVGTVPVGTQCLGDAVIYSGASTYYAVPSNVVSVPPNIKPKSTILVAACAYTS